MKIVPLLLAGLVTTLSPVRGGIGDDALLEQVRQLGVSPVAERPSAFKIESRPRRFEIFLP